ncbi:hypothetical protein MSG28_010760 [Choristoneura fumiferana]|uniref:Uncharacterized protein n=1 Tax=Choristoneura fumiferana TaxID=7141 RepID=A0ACC0KPF5_CHOFU|nr:hypothetical protein MSG28_010760 [Choristoneura fumiferana]
MCSKKCATPLFLEFSYLEPASIHRPTVAVAAPESSEATRSPLSSTGKLSLLLNLSFILFANFNLVFNL